MSLQYPTPPDSQSGVYAQQVDQVVALIDRNLPDYGLTLGQKRCAAATMLQDQNSAVNAQGARALLALMDRRDKAHKKKSKLHINVAVSSEQQASLVKLYPQFNLIFGGRGRERHHRKHSLAAISRYVEYEILSRKVGKFNKNVTDIGGNYMANTPYHCCCPVLDSRDRERYATREQDLQKEYEFEVSKRHPDNKKIEKLKNFANKEKLSYYDFERRGRFAQHIRCFNRAQDCPIRSEYGIMVHSAYDIKKTEIPEIMQNKGMSQLFGSMLWPADIRDKFSGEMKLLGAYYDIDPEKDVIRFTFEDDSSYMYQHTFSDYISYGHDEELEYQGQRFVYRIFDRRDGLIFYTVVKIPETVKVPVAMCDQMFRNRATAAVVVKTFKLNHRYGLDDPRAYEPLKALMPLDVFEVVMKRYLSRDEENLTREQVFLALRSNNVRFLINGRTYTTGERIDYETFNAIVAALMSIAVREQHLMNATTTITLGQIDDERALFNTGSLFLKAFATVVKRVLHMLYEASDLPLKYLKKQLLEQLSGKYEKGVLEVMHRFTYSKVTVPQGFTSAYYEHLVDHADWVADQLQGFPTELPTDQVDLDLDLLRALRSYVGTEVFDSDVNLDMLDQLITLRVSVETGDLSAVDPVEEVKPLEDFGIEAIVNCEELRMDPPIFVKDQLNTFPQAESLRHARFVPPESIDGRTCTVEQYMQYTVAAIGEAERYCRFGALSAVTDAKIHFSRSVMNDRYCEDYMRSQINEKISPNFIFFDRRGWSTGSLLPTSTTYMVGMADDGTIVPISYRVNAGRKLAYISGSFHRLFVYAQFSVYNGPKLASCFEKLLQEPLKVSEVVKPEISMIDGIAGCGKTTMVINQFAEKGVENSLVVSACREAADDARKRIVEQGICDDYIASQRVRTIDSYLINGGPEASFLLIDEVFMAHPGFVSAVILKSKAKYVWLYGDSFQIPFINRYSGAIDTHFSRFTLYNSYEFRAVTHRCPVDVCVAVRSLYRDKGDRIRTSSSVVRSLDIVVIDSILRVPCDDEWFYLTFFQAEADDLRKKGYKHVSTVHEAEGKTLAHKQVALIRGVLKTHQIFDSAEHLLVGLTRHTKKLTYFTVRDDDRLSGIIRTGMLDVGQYSSIQL